MPACFVSYLPMKRTDRSTSGSISLGIFPIVLFVISLVAMVASFVLTNSVRTYETSIPGFLTILVAYSMIFGLYCWSVKRSGTGSRRRNRRVGDVDIDTRLMAIDEASRYFSGSLNSTDMFRLVASRANEVIPFTACALFVIDKSTQRMRIKHAHGENAEILRNLEMSATSGLAGSCQVTGLVQTDAGMMVGKDELPAKALSGFRSAAAIPLMHDGEPFAVLQLYSDSRTAFDGDAVSILEAVGERLTPLILSTFAFERSRSKALTDPVTDLPNERAFHLVLENQLAESQRNRDRRSLTILAVDIKDFDELNLKYGHAAGDRILEFVAGVVKDNLRQMDFFARSHDDEFLAILPTAGEETADEIVGRINNGLMGSRFSVNDSESITIDLNFGAATFGLHGETSESLLAAARTTKRQSKANAPRKVLWFPKELIG